MTKSEQIFRDYESLVKFAVIEADLELNLEHYEFKEIKICQNGVEVWYFDTTGFYPTNHKDFEIYVFLSFEKLDKRIESVQRTTPQF